MVSTASQHGRDVNRAMNHGVRYISGDTPSASCERKKEETESQVTRCDQLSSSYESVRPFAILLIHFEEEQIHTQVGAIFSPFDFPVQVDAASSRCNFLW